MSKAVKEMITEELRRRYVGMDSACVVDLTGMDVQEQEKLRGILRDRSTRFEVVKNSLARRAFQGSPLEPLGNALEGPCAVVTSSEPLVDAAKMLVEATKEFAQLKLKQAIVGGEPKLLTIVDVSKMKSRAELLSELAMLISSSGGVVAGCLSSPQSKVAGCLKAMIDKAA